MVNVVHLAAVVHLTSVVDVIQLAAAVIVFTHFTAVVNALATAIVSGLAVVAHLTAVLIALVVDALLNAFAVFVHVIV